VYNLSKPYEKNEECRFSYVVKNSYNPMRKVRRKLLAYDLCKNTYEKSRDISLQRHFE
jgi:hypothetical protein